MFWDLKFSQRLLWNCSRRAKEDHDEPCYDNSYPDQNNLTLSYNVRLGLQNFLFPSVFPINILYSFSFRHEYHIYFIYVSMALQPLWT
jgi:hypothetical protein